MKNSQKINPYSRNFYLKMLHILKGFIINNNGTEAEAEDIVQEAFARYLEKIQNENMLMDSDPSKLLYSIARNLWIDELRKKKVRGRKIQFNEIQIEENNKEIERKIKNERKQKLIENKIRFLDEMCRKIINLRNAGLSFDDIAEEINISDKSNIYTRFYRCRKKLKELVTADKEFSKIMRDE